MTTDAQAPDRLQLFQRHDLVWLKDTDTPYVVTRRSVTQVMQRTLALGRCFPATQGGKPQRLAATASEADVLRWRPALSVAEMLLQSARLPATWTYTLRQLLAVQAQFALTLRVYGSLAWQVLDPSCSQYIRELSDIDLLVTIPEHWQGSQLLALCAALEDCSARSVVAGGPALDGELRLAGRGDVAWREWIGASARGDRVLLKDAVNVRMAHAQWHPAVGQPDSDQLDRWACAALREEAMAWPKPGLVSPVDRGSHHDMDIHLLLRAIDALQGWFALFARAARAGAEFAELAALGRAAELAMLEATDGVNAYRGAIFNLGLLVSAAALAPAGVDPCMEVARRWAEPLRAHRPPANSHGQSMRRREGAGGALLQAARGFPALRQVVLPAYLQAQQLGFDADRRVAAACLAGIAVLEDTNLLWRGGAEGLQWAQQAARDCLDQGGVNRPDWVEVLAALHAEFVTRRLSPGGSADLAGCAAFLARLQAMR